MYKLENLQFNLKTFNCERSNDRQRQRKQNRLLKSRIASDLVTDLEVYIDDQDLWNYFILTFKIPKIGIERVSKQQTNQDETAFHKITPVSNEK